MLRQFIEWLESGEKTADQLLEICLRRIAEVEADVRAWVEISPREPPGEGPLRGIPFGVKDIFETRGMATEYGSPLYAGRKGACDAALVAELCRRGAVLLGKTHTTAFAYFDPAPTRNPRDLRHTPGGSSSGSAAAVAAGMAPFALGTQTQGSVLRPASYCGVTGFKPTFGLLPLEGVLPFAPSLDTAGLFTQTPEDMKVLWTRMGFPAGGDFGRRWACTGDMQVEAPVPLVHTKLPEGFQALVDAARTLNDYEGARTHRERWERFGERLGAKLAAMVASGLRIPDERYLAARDLVSHMQREMSAFFREYPVVLTPAATGPAPAGLKSTGDPRCNAPWTALGTPAIAVPLPGDGLSVGVQMTADRGRDAMLVEAAVMLEDGDPGRVHDFHDHGLQL